MFNKEVVMQDSDNDKDPVWFGVGFGILILSAMIVLHLAYEILMVAL